MSEWTTLLTTRSNQPVLTQLRFDVRRYAWAEQGGPSVAEIAVDGDNLTSALDLIGCKVQVLAPDLTACWWGLVEEVAVSEGGSEYAVSLSDMANRISVIYSIASEGGAVTAQTAWAEDQRSIELYGRKELLHSMGTGTPDEAQRTLAQLLAQMSMPRLSVRPGRSGKAGAALHCVGYWQTLDWQYFAQGAGRIVHAGENEVEALLGWGFQSSQLVGFNSRDRRVHQLGALLGALSEGDRISVTGSTSNNGSFTVTEPAQVDKQVVYNSGSISFDPSDDMHDGNEWLDQFKAGEMLYVQDSTSNNGFWFVKGVAPDHITLHPETVVAESGGTATITQGNSVQVQEALTLEKPVPGSKFITVQAHGVKMAQSFVVPGADGAWTAGEVTVYLHRVGNPSDSVKVELCADNGSGGAGTVLDSALVAGSSLPTNSTAVTFGLARTAQLSRRLDLLACYQPHGGGKPYRLLPGRLRRRRRLHGRQPLPVHGRGVGSKGGFAQL
jgi:hypothetical protein